MKHIILYTLLVLGIILSACQSEKIPEESLTLDDKKVLLSKKQEERKILDQEISILQDEIISLSPELQEKAALVDTLHMVSQNFIRYIEIQGVIQADERVNVVSEIPGRVLVLTAKEGDIIAKGQLIATLDVENTQNQINEVNTALSLAQDVYERQSRLWDQKIGSEVQYLQAKNNVDRLNKSLETLQYQLTKAKVYAPISGTVLMENIKQGEFASPGVPIIQILNTSKINISTDLPERYLTIMKLGDKVEMNFPSVNIQMPGKVIQLGSTIDAANRTLEVKIAPSKFSPYFKPNLLAEIKVEELNIPNIITIPVEYVLQEVDGKEFVYVVETNAQNETRAAKRYVTTGESALNQIIVTSGLSQNEAIVTRGARNISSGELVSFIERKD
jgi:membrane fusion protein, multidrug efflux system